MTFSDHGTGPHRLGWARGRRVAAFTLLSMLLLLGCPVQVLARGVLRSSEPANGADLSEVPDELRLRLNERVELPFARIQLIGPGAAMVDARNEGVIGHVGIAFAFVELAMIYTIDHLSGAHINPAVTIAFWSAGRFPAQEVLPYVGAQSLGAVLASAVLRWILRTAHWIYWIAPVSAMILAAMAYDLLRLARVPQIVPPGVPLGVQGPLDREAEVPSGAGARA